MGVDEVVAAAPDAHPRRVGPDREPEHTEVAGRQVVDADEGHLRVRRTALPATAELDAVDLRGEQVHLRIRPVDGMAPGAHLLLLDQDDRLLGTVPTTEREGLLDTLVGVADLPAGFFGMLRLAIGTEQTHTRVRRRGNDLVDPNHAALLPELFASDAHGGLSDQPRARFRWNPDGLLALRSIDPEDADR